MFKFKNQPDGIWTILIFVFILAITITTAEANAADFTGKWVAYFPNRTI